jgi:hypothetical protein
LSTYQNQSFPSFDCGICSKHNKKYMLHLPATSVCKLKSNNVMLWFCGVEKIEVKLLIPCYWTLPHCHHKSMPWACQHPLNTFSMIYFSTTFSHVSLCQKYKSSFTWHLTNTAQRVCDINKLIFSQSTMRLPVNVVHMFTINNHINFHMNNCIGLFYFMMKSKRKTYTVNNCNFISNLQREHIWGATVSFSGR